MVAARRTSGRDRRFGTLLAIGDLKATPSRRAAEEIKHASERAAALTGQLLAFGRKQILQPKVVDLNDVVEGMGALLAPLSARARA